MMQNPLILQAISQMNAGEYGEISSLRDCSIIASGINGTRLNSRRRVLNRIQDRRRSPSIGNSPMLSLRRDRRRMDSLQEP